ncbi:MAG: hypothetical protein IJW29_09985 [Clostridia bacterium]|nr:hypothetical protein [Clostridia bacterium]MBQ9785819.1 hypothetical protein [Clostridia bacterium]
MRRFRYRRRAHSGGGKKLAPWAIVLIVAAGALLLTVIIGNLLKLWLDDEAYRRLRDGEDTTGKQEEPLFRADVPDVHAYPYEIGDSMYDVLELPAVSFTLNTPDGKTVYTSAVTDYFGIPTTGDAPLDGTMSELLTAASYVGGVFHPQAFGDVDADLTYAKTAVDCALLREFVQAGGREVLLCGIPFEALTADEIVSYLTEIKAIMGKRPLGVAIPLSVAQRADAWELIGAMGEVCDFFALDMRDSTAPLTDANFYLGQYDMRLLLDETQTDHIQVAQDNLPTFQVVTKLD